MKLASDTAADQRTYSLGPIGVFDSGVGGLTVLKAIQSALPQEELLYVADSANAPYGDRDAAFISERAVAISAFLEASGAKAIVVACNTATVIAIDTLRARFAVPVIALEPAIKPAAAMTRTGIVAVMATSRTLESPSVARLCQLYGGNARVLLQPCPGLVEQVERGEIDSDRTLQLLADYVRPVVDAGADTIVLGCTHYPFLAAQISAVAGGGVTLLDSAEAVARQVQRRVALADPIAGRTGAPVTFFASGNPEQAAATISRLWGVNITVQSLPSSHEVALGKA